MKYLFNTLLLCAFTLLVTGCEQNTNISKTTPAASQEPKVEVKVVVVNMFEIGEDEGDKAGEFQLWKAGQKLTKKFDFPQSHHDLYFNEETGVLGMVTGMGTARSASAIMALGLDPRFDLTKAYWLVAGIAGIDPHDASIGSAVWTTWLIDGDLSHEIDAREIPSDWESGYFPLFSHGPYKQGATAAATNHTPAGEVYKINAQLADWAFELTKETPLTDYPAMQALRAKYVNYPKAQLPPFVLKGDHMAASTFWHGKLLNEWANSWSKFWSNGEANFVTSGMEDTGTYQALTYLDAANKADKSRFMVLRTGSNYSMQPESLTAAENLKLESGENGFAGLQSSLESAYSVGSIVVNDIVTHWAEYKNSLPYEVNE